MHLKFKFCVSGAAETGHCAPDALEKTKELGRLIVKHNGILVTGATTGAPYWAAIGAKEAGGFVVGYSPAASEREHVNKYRLPLDYHDTVVYTGFGYSGRNLLLTRASDAVLITCGRIGTLNEFTIAFEDSKPIGVLTDTGIPKTLPVARLDMVEQKDDKIRPLAGLGGKKPPAPPWFSTTTPWPHISASLGAISRA